ncbi:cysteine hydrolase family protein [Brevibacillus centrosporus]|uniref:cysteine hydrolase family protein n=1 Tax=Brevibacillus centrosporus TaxID=54910 RepID=UPI002E225D43|nr:cysteine hydrolase family protein [Brevibacillus centrosporus]
MEKNTALLVIDVQNFMIEHAYQGNAFLTRIEKLIGQARELQIPVVYIRHTEEEGEFKIDTPTWQIHPAIAPLENDPVFNKSACDSFLGTPLQEELQSKGIEQLIVVGFQSEYCIDTTSRRAISLGYDVTLASDCHSTFDSSVLKAEQIIAHHNQTLGGFGTPSNQIRVVSSDEIFREA